MNQRVSDTRIAPIGDKQTLLPPENYLEVGLTADGREVLVNHPKLLTDQHGVGHIVFSAEQARNLARLLLRKADECRP